MPSSPSSVLHALQSYHSGSAGISVLIVSHSEGSFLDCRLRSLRQQRDAEVMAECTFQPKLVAQPPWPVSPMKAQPEVAAGVRMYSAALEAHQMREERVRKMAEVWSNF